MMTMIIKINISIGKARKKNINVFTGDAMMMTIFMLNAYMKLKWSFSTSIIWVDLSLISFPYNRFSFKSHKFQFSW